MIDNAKENPDSTANASQETEENSADVKKQHWALRLGLVSTKIIFLGTLIVIALVILAVGIIENTNGIISFKETLERVATPLLAARLTMYLAGTFLLPKLLFFSASKSKDEAVSMEAKKYEKYFQCLIGGMFVFGEIFIVQNVLGTLLR